MRQHPFWNSLRHNLSETTMNAPPPSPFQPTSLSVLAVGICGNARLHEKLGSSEASRAVDRCFKRIERAVDASDGRITCNSSEELIAVFNSAEAAIHASVEMQQRIATLPPVSGVKIAIRVGITHALAQEALSEEMLTREAARLAGIAKSGQILACERISKALPEALRAKLTESGLVLPGESGEEAALEVLLEAPVRAASPAGGGEAALAENVWLRLHYGGNTVVFEKYRHIIDMGRDNTCDIIIRDIRASRHHAVIRNDNGIVTLIDSSRNGTYVTLSGESEQLVKGSECLLHGRGTIVFAASSSAPNADGMEFECL
jgi:class 3 adenylate cyclase